MINLQTRYDRKAGEQPESPRHSEFLIGLVFEQTEESFGWLVDPIRVFLDEFPDASVHCLRVEFGIRLLNSGFQLCPAQTLRMLVEQLEGRCIDPLGDFG